MFMQSTADRSGRMLFRSSQIQLYTFDLRMSQSYINYQICVQLSKVLKQSWLVNRAYGSGPGLFKSTTLKSGVKEFGKSCIRCRIVTWVSRTVTPALPVTCVSSRSVQRGVRTIILQQTSAELQKWICILCLKLRISETQSWVVNIRKTIKAGSGIKL
jgi:hypothetical protein